MKDEDFAALIERVRTVEVKSATRLEHAFAPLEVKFADDAPAGTFEGYGAVFGNVDAYGDVIQPGAFKGTLSEWRKAKRLPPMLVQHGGWMITDTDGLPVGKWEAMSEDDHGLAVKGRVINLDTERGKTIHGAMKEGTLDGLSIGFRAKEFELGTKPEEPRRKLKKIDLVEVSIVTFPANGLARTASVKGIAEMSERELERWLARDAGLSVSQAKAFIAGGFKALKGTRDAAPGETGLDEAIRQATALIRSA